METLAHLRTQPETLDVLPRQQRILIGIPKETTLQENRVALVPHAVATLTAHGHRVLVENGAGEKANFSDFEYAEVGAQLAHSAEEYTSGKSLIVLALPAPARVCRDC